MSTAIWKQKVLGVLTVAAALVLGADSLASDGPRLGESDPNKAIQLVTFRAHSRLILKIDAGVQPEWKEIPRGFELTLKGLGLVDLGAPLGLEEKWATEIEREFHDSRVEKVELLEKDGALVIRGRWKFSSGENAPAAPRMERFDYRLKDPVQYVVDFWPKEGPTVAEARLAKDRALREAERQRVEAESKRRRERRLAAIRTKAVEEDLTRFCGRPMRDGEDVFMEFVPHRAEVDYAQYLPSATPDAQYDYYLETGDDVARADGPDASYVRTALKLYHEGQFALSIKAIDLFERDFPKSVFRPEMVFLKANSLIKLGHADQAMPLLRDIVAREKVSAVAIHAAMFLAHLHIKAGENLQALERFLWLSTHYPSHRLNWFFHLAAAESLKRMKQVVRAVKEYEFVEKNAPTEGHRALAAFRIGDLYLESKQYERALASYFEAMKRHPAEAEKDPAIHLNRAEALYWIGDYRGAEDGFLKFIEKFPNNPIAWRASFRLGELNARSEGEAKQVQSRKYFSDTVNKYPYSPGATLARAVLASCGDHGGMTFEAASRFFEGDAQKFDGGGEIVMNRYPDFRAIQRVRAYVSFDRYAEAVLAGIAESDLREMTTDGRKRVARYVRPALRKNVLSNLESGNAFAAVKFYRDHSVQVGEIDPSTQLESPDYLLRLARAATDLGMPELATDISSAYKKAEERKNAERSIASDDDESSDPIVREQRLIESDRKNSEKNYTQAKGLWTKSGSGWAKKITDENKIRDLLLSVSDESPFSLGKEIVLGRLDEHAGKQAAALAHAMKARLLLGSQGSVADADRLDAWIARLQAQSGDARVAIEMLKALQKRAAHARNSERTPASLEASEVSALGVSPVPKMEDLILSEGELHAKLGNWGEAAAAYSRAVEAGLGGNRAIYEYARAMSRSPAEADRTKGRDRMKDLADNGKEDFWKKLAAEQLAREKLEN